MDGKALMAALRKTDTSPEVTQLLAALGYTKKLKMPANDIEARIDLPNQGLSMIFKPQAPKTSVLALVAVQFFAEGESGFKGFSGSLPEKLRFSDTQAEVIKKLGKPTESMKQLRRDRWEATDLVLTVKYSKTDGRVATVAIHAPEYY